MMTYTYPQNVAVCHQLYVGGFMSLEGNDMVLITVFSLMYLTKELDEDDNILNICLKNL